MLNWQLRQQKRLHGRMQFPFPDAIHKKDKETNSLSKYAIALTVFSLAACNSSEAQFAAEQTANYMGVFEGWNITLRIYEPTEDYFNGEWVMPELELVD